MDTSAQNPGATTGAHAPPAAAAPAAAWRPAHTVAHGAHAERWPVICGACGGATSRVALLAPARWLSLLVTVRRYRCDSARCGWHGNVFG